MEKFCGLDVRKDSIFACILEEQSKKFSEKRQSEFVKYANEELITNLLDSYEDLERAINNSQTEEDLMEGIKLIYKKMTNVLEKEGLKVIPAKGEKFDPYKHEALMATKSDDYENGEIIDVLNLTKKEAKEYKKDNPIYTLEESDDIDTEDE